ncbi:putative nitrate/nitrite transporter (narK) [Candidatus Competibacter denitrificans Run_A_D11]|uniref:Nitrate/nitrite transporter (NarK) n=1 Tax=Candidatus Competibacter denitrificans Run_A_D11 TaxID=1400863 RepID=W6M6Q1_9GAMM|nr:MFS transporter [Candidatus Competibacter denitrificans]CDI03362.1 putative nitrate/nitrite transporter (narK) [Candidatus Competibacter denitrificans Run_A_D11]
MATLKQQQISVLTMNTMAFAVNFAVWVMFSVIGIKIKAELNLNETEFGLLVATPILTGSLVRLPLGILTDRYGGRIVFFIQMLLVSIPTWLVSYATEYWQYLVLGLFVGLAGGSFAVGIAYTSTWFSKERQGTAMGIFGAGNAGSSLTKFVAPMIIAAFGAWQMVPKVYAVAMIVMAILFWFFTYTDPLHQKDAAQNRVRPSLGQQLQPLLDARVWRFGLAYAFVFGGFVALALWLPKYYVGEYGLPLATAAFLTIFFDLPSGAIRALGGWASDKWGGNTVTWWVLWISLICLFVLSYPPTTMTIHGIKGDVSVNLGIGIVLFTVLAFVVGMAQGFGKASVYRSLADYYPTQMGVVGGIVGLIGGLGGFVMPIMFGVAADAVGVRSSCFMLMFLLVVVTMLWTWVAEKNEREEILERHADARAELAGANLVDRIYRRRHLLADWRPDDEAFWQSVGRRIANRNLWLSMPALLLAFAVWVVWSVIVVELPRVGFKFSQNQLFWLAALPGLSGPFFRALYSFVVPIFGGRNWTVFSTALLLLPTLWIGVAVQDPNTNYAVFVAIALLCGLGAGNFSSSMANISFFFPQRLQGTALGLNGGVGNLGVGIAQLIVPIAMYGGALWILGGNAQNRFDEGIVTPIWLQNAGFIWVPFIVAASVAAWFGMDNIGTVKAGFAEQVAIFRHKHQWLMSWLYTGTFGSFIGLAVTFPMLVNTAFPTANTFKFAFVGPLLAALVRPLGGWLSDRIGGAIITCWVFVAMTAASFGALLFLPGLNGGDGNMSGFITMYLMLFVAAGIGNGSTFRMIPIIFRVLRQRRIHGKDRAALEEASHLAATEAAATLGFSSAVAAFGGFFIPIAYGASINLTGGYQAALMVFALFYLSCLWVTWRWYAGKNVEAPC